MYTPGCGLGGIFKKEVHHMKKLKRTSALFLALVMTLATAVFILPASAAEYDFPDGAAEVSVTLDGRSVLQGQAAIINSVTYVPVRAFAELLGASSVTWNARSSTATVKKGSYAIYLTDGALYVGANGRYFFTVEEILNINNRLFVPVRPYAKALGASVDWDGATRTVEIRTQGKLPVSGASFYNSNDLYWLSRIISAEAAGESLEGQIAVGNVVLNRRAHPSYPNTVYGVIFDRKGGTQFSPVSMGTIYNTPSESSIIAAKLCLEGYSLDNAVLFFMNPRISTSNWISNNRPFAFTIGLHDFYY